MSNHVFVNEPFVSTKRVKSMVHTNIHVYGDRGGEYRNLQALNRSVHSPDNIRNMKFTAY